VFASTGAVMVNQISDGAVTHLGVSFVFGAVVAALIYGIGHLRRTFLSCDAGVLGSGFFPSAECCLMSLAQSLGAIAASIVLLVALGLRCPDGCDPAPEWQLVSIFGARNRSDVHPDVCDFGFWA